MTAGVYTVGPSSARLVQSSPRTGEAINYYVSGLNGNDNNDGLTSGSPFATLTKAESLIPEIVDSPVIIHIGNHGGTGYAPPIIRPRLLKPNCNIYWWGDGAGQPGEDGFVVQVSGTAVATTNVNQITTGVPKPANAYRGYFIRMTSGAAAGQIRQIRDNTTTIFTVTVPFTLTPAATDTWDIIQPDIIILFPDTASSSFTGETNLVTGCGAPGGQHINSTTSGAVWFISNVWNGAGTVPGVQITDSKVVMVGVMILAAQATRPLLRVVGSQLFAGLEIADFTGTGFSTQAQTDLGLPTGTWLSGCGFGVTISTTRLTIAGNSQFRGSYVGPGFVVSQHGELTLTGGNLFGTSDAGTSALEVSTGADAAISAATGTPVLISDVSTLGSIRVYDGGVLTITTVTITNTVGACIIVQNDGLVESGSSTVTGTGTTFGVQCQFGGKFYVAGACAVLGPSNSDLSVDGIAGAGYAVATLAASGDTIMNVADGSLIMRTA